MSESTSKRVCAGPVYYGDQGIEVCEICGGCICCDHADVDHKLAERRCVALPGGTCALYAHAGRPCKSDPAEVRQ